MARSLREMSQHKVSQDKQEKRHSKVKKKYYLSISFDFTENPTPLP